MKYLVYEHRRLDSGEIFYIGIADNDKRPFNTVNRSDFWRKVFNKVGREVRIVTTCDTLIEACQIEKYLIAYYGRRDLGLGTLVNLTDGGESGSRDYSALTKEIISLKSSITHLKKRNRKVKTYLDKEAKLKKLLRLKRDLPKIIDSYEKISSTWGYIQVIDISTGIVYDNIYCIPYELHYLMQSSLRKALTGTNKNKTNLRLK